MGATDASRLQFDGAGTNFAATDVNAAIIESVTPFAETTSTTLNGNVSLTNLSRKIQVLTGTATGFSVTLPDATTLNSGQQYEIYNETLQNITIKDNTGATIFVLSQTSIAYITLHDNSTAAGDWIYWQIFISVAGGILNYNLTSSTPFNTSSRFPAFVAITGFSVTPTAGTYAIWYNASVFYTTTPKAHYWTIYKNGVAIADSARQQDTAHSDQTMVDTTQAIVSCNGTDVIDVRVSCANTGTLTVNSRTMVLIRLGN